MSRTKSIYGNVAILNGNIIPTKIYKAYITPGVGLGTANITVDKKYEIVAVNATGIVASNITTTAVNIISNNFQTYSLGSNVVLDYSSANSVGLSLHIVIRKISPCSH